MKTNELHPGEIYSYGSSPNRVQTRSAVIPLVTDAFLQQANNWQMRGQGKPHLYRAPRKTYSAGNPYRGLLVLLSHHTTPEELAELREHADRIRRAPAPEEALPHSAGVTKVVSWALVNPAWVRETWADHLDRLQEIKLAAARQAEVIAQQSAQRNASTALLQELLRAKGIHLPVNRYTDHQTVPTTTLIQILERVQ